MDFKKYIASRIKAEGLSEEELCSLIAVPPNTEMGDYALPCFRLAKTMRKSPAAIAEELAAAYPADEIVTGAQAVNGYVNFRIDRALWSEQTLRRVLSEREAYGSSDEGKGKTVCIEYSSVNIAKPFHIGHLSSTVIGSALYKLHKFLGYPSVAINHLGDYGTQFGKLISAYKRWGSREEIEKGGLRALNALYVRFHEEAERDPSLNDEARHFFKKIEEKDEESVALFEWFKQLTLKDVGRIYDLLDVHFDSWAGESFYIDKMQPVIDELKEKGLLVESEGAQIVDLSAYDMPPCLVLRSDGASLYATRDLAAAIYRKQTYDFYKSLYVVAYQQNLHFRQFFKVLELMGKEWAKDLVHVAYGMVSLEEGSMSTRKGRVVYLEDVIDKCVEKALAIITEKNPSLENKEETAKTVGVGAVIFGALYNNKIKDITFSYDKVLNFEGETSCYVQYTCARAHSVLEKGGSARAYAAKEVCPQEFEVVKQLAEFPATCHDALEKYEPCFIARYCVDLAQKFNKFYFDCSILNAEDGQTRAFRLALTEATLVTLKNGLGLLGIGVPEKM
ncbi:MAG TPA: arginine--tRNA ligase [Candidatus Borkfalkia avicola]|uniref:Arginine--tRNA ligase n=1 Tax=Candidatus Borkfalkia avicola TaxID=2838503 RepID=A0A9D2II41_9FIRM|nr:arginine--tRNA ligase [Candidatus Borkfalkia avicola]